MQRITALNFICTTITRKTFCASVIPKDRLGSHSFRPEFMNFDVPRNIYIHICGTDLIRDRDGQLSRARGQCALSLRVFPTCSKIARR